MTSKNSTDAKAAMDRFKTEVASELGVNLKDGYNGDLTAREVGSIGGEMVKRMIKKTGRFHEIGFLFPVIISLNAAECFSLRGIFLF